MPWETPETKRGKWESGCPDACDSVRANDLAAVNQGAEGLHLIGESVRPAVDTLDLEGADFQSDRSIAARTPHVVGDSTVAEATARARSLRILAGIGLLTSPRILGVDTRPASKRPVPM